MDRSSVVRRLLCIGFFIACCCYRFATGLPNLYNVYANRKGGAGGEEKPILAMANSPRCLYNGRPVENGFKVPNSEPCLNCTCNDGVLLCYLQTCPTLVVPSKECHVGRAEGTCCPQVRCKNLNSPDHYSLYWNNKPKIPYYKYAPDEAGEKGITDEAGNSYNTAHLFVGSNHNAQYSDQFYNRFRRTSKNPHLTTPSSESSTSRRRPQPQIQLPDDQDLNFQSGVPPDFENFQNGTTGDCYSKGFKYSEGMAMLSSSKCEYCYCIRGQQMCVRPKCHLNIGGCVAKYQSGFTCCPSHYECELSANGKDDNFASIENTIRVPAEDKVSSCKVDSQEYEVGVAVASKGHCQTCYCTQVGIVCRRIECSPAVEGCTAIIPEGHCCPTEYECEDAASNRTKIPVSHSTDNYDVMVISPSESSSTKDDYSSESDQETYSSNSDYPDSTTEKDRITIHLGQDSSVNSISVIPEENLAVLVLTTEKSHEDETQTISTNDKIRGYTSTSIATSTLQRQSEHSTMYPTEIYSSATATNGITPEQHTELLPNSEATGDQSTTTKHQDVIPNTDAHQTTSGSETSSDDGDYYYEDYYPSEEYYSPNKLPQAQVEVSAKETFAPFSDYGTPGDDEKISSTQGHSHSTAETDGSSTKTTFVFHNQQEQSTQQGTSPFYGVEGKTTNTETFKHDETTIDGGTTYTILHDKTEGASTVEETDPSSTFQSVSFSTETRPSETTYNLETQETFGPDQTTNTPKRTMYTSLSTQTIPPKRTMYTSLSTQTIPPTITERADTERNTYYIQEEEQRLTPTSTENTQADDIDKYLTTNTAGTYREVITDRTENSIFQQKASTIPIDVVELILAITQSQSAGTDETQQDNTEYTETETTPRSNVQASVQVNGESSQPLALAAPKLIIEQTTTQENGVSDKAQTVSLTTDSNLLKYKSPLVVFSNHGPSAPIRPLSSVQTGMPAVVNNHKIVSNHYPARQKPYRPTVTTTSQSPSTTAVEFSNHRPTNTFRRPPITMTKGQSRPGMVMKIGVQKTNTARPNDGSFKNHRIVSDSGDHHNDPIESPKGLNKESEGNDYEEIQRFLEKPVSVFLTVDNHDNNHPLKTQIQSNHSPSSTDTAPLDDIAKEKHEPEFPLLKEKENSKSASQSESSGNKDYSKFILKPESTSNHAPSSTLETKKEHRPPTDDAKLSRADDEIHIEDAESPFVDRRLTSYGGGPYQRLPETKLNPHNQGEAQKPNIAQEEGDQEIADVCFVDGRYYKSGEVIVKSNPCEMCRCFYGYPLCQVQQCPTPPNPSCVLEYLPGYCCPRVTCGVNSDAPKLTDEVSPPVQEPAPQTSLLASDNQWRPLPNAYPQGMPNLKKDTTNINIIQNKDQGISNEVLKTQDSSSNVKNVATNDVIKLTKVTIPSNDMKEQEVETTSLSSLPTVSPTDPNPVFKPIQKKENGSSIHDNSSGVRKILDDSVVLPASKVSLSPVNNSDIKTVLPLIHAIPTSAPAVKPNTAIPVLASDSDAKSEISSEFGGNLKISGCNVYGQYYKINDKVSALSKPCTECTCSADGISCNEIC